MFDLKDAIARADADVRRAREAIDRLLATNEAVVHLIVYGGVMLAAALGVVALIGKVAGL